MHHRSSVVFDLYWRRIATSIRPHLSCCPCMHAQVDADNMLIRGGLSHVSNMLSGLSNDSALAAHSDMIDDVATSAASVAQSGQGGEISTAFNLNELLAAMEKAAAAGENSGQPSSALPDNVEHEEGGGA